MAEGGGVDPHSLMNAPASNGAARPLAFTFRGGKPRS